MIDAGAEVRLAGGSGLAVHSPGVIAQLPQLGWFTTASSMVREFISQRCGENRVMAIDSGICRPLA
jgi:hypothetical protein